ncbi:MAG: hypothetical protein QM682_14625 [Paracoccus sp. (in: a-proteobacteria)]|uniref:COG4223 family protein n=1 Tax=Paracoccus sp. TaxID=267 RepID=UPI0039E293CB
MNDQDSQNGQGAATPGTEGKKPAVQGSVIDSRPVESGLKPGVKAADAKSEPQPVIESNLVGEGGGSARPAAQAKAPPAAEAPPAEKQVEKQADKPLAASGFPVTGPAQDGAKPGPGADQPAAAKPAAETPKATPASSRVAEIPAPQPKVIETRVVERRGGLVPTFLGGVVAAGLGAAACYWAIPHLPPAWQPVPQVAVPDGQLDAAARRAAADAVQAEFQNQGEALTRRAADAGADAARQILADTPPPAPGAPVALPAEVGERIAALEQALTNLHANPGPAPAGPGIPPGALDELAARLGEQQARIDELAARPTVDPATAQQVQDLARQAQELQSSTEAANRRALAATAAAALQAAIENAAPREQALADLGGAGVQVPAVLTGEIPRLDQLRSEFPEAARAGLAASIKAVSAQEGALDRISNFLRVQTGARSVEPREGDDPDAVLSRADAAVETGNIGDALAQIAILPQPGQEAMAAWTARAQTWIQANAALAGLAAAVQ